jgi:catalase
MHARPHRYKAYPTLRMLAVKRAFYSIGGAVVLALGISAQPAPAVAQSEEAGQLIGDLHAAFGNHHARAIHAKGIILEGSFKPTKEAREMCIAPVFTSATVPVTVRFSDFTGLPDIPDTSDDANPRGFAVKFRLADGSEMDIVTHSFNGFPVATVSEFGELMRAIGASGSNATKPTAMDRFLDAHPIAKTFLTTQKPPPASYGSAAYYGVNSLSFVDGQGGRAFVRYRFVPSSGELYLNPAALRPKQPNYLQEEIEARVAGAPVRFDWYAQIAASGDKVDDPSIAWPEDRKLVKLGTISIDRMTPNQSASDKSLLFMPASVPVGIEIADPMLSVRNVAYPISFGERQ